MRQYLVNLKMKQPPSRYSFKHFTKDWRNDHAPKNFYSVHCPSNDCNFYYIYSISQSLGYRATT